MNYFSMPGAEVVALSTSSAVILTIPKKPVTTPSSFYRQRRQGPERFSSSSKVKQLMKVELDIKPRARNIFS